MPDETTNGKRPDLAGELFGNYRVLRKIGSGGMADVYLAEQLSLSRQVALKVLPAELAADASYVQRFINEARAAASLIHANIVQIYEVGSHAGLHYISQEYVRGKNLGQLLEREGALRPALVLDVLRQVVAALAKAAEKAIIHRDIKPENILLSHGGEVKVADFGLARALNTNGESLTQVGVTMGTPLYMSPEQIEGKQLDPRSDIYSLGVTAYHLLAGRPPHAGDTALAIAVQHLNAVPDALENVCPSVPEPLARVVHRMMAKQPGTRYATAGDLLADLKSVAEEGSVSGWSESPAGWRMADTPTSAAPLATSTRELKRLLRSEAELDSQTPRLFTRKRLGWWLAAAAAGIFLGVATRPGFYLRGGRPDEVERRESAWAQMYQAKLSPSEDAWLAVRDYFPDEDPFVYQQSDQGLVRYYLLISQEYGKAVGPLQRLREQWQADRSNLELGAFTHAGLCVALEQLDDIDRARQAASAVTPELRDVLRSNEQPIYELFRSATDRLQP